MIVMVVFMFMVVYLHFFRKWQKYSQQKGGQKTKTLKQLRQIVHYSVGDDHDGNYIHLLTI